MVKNLNGQTIFSNGGEWDYYIRFYDGKNNITDSGYMSLLISTERDPNIGQLKIMYYIRLKSDNYVLIRHPELAIDKESLNKKYLNLITQTIMIPADMQKPQSLDQLLSDSMNIIVPEGTRHFMDSLLSDPNFGKNANLGSDSIEAKPGEVFTAAYFEIKPPRTGKLLFTQLAPFPICDENYFAIARKDSLFMKDMAYISNPAIYFGSATAAYYFKGKTAVNIMNKQYKDCYYIHSVSVCGLGKYMLDYYFAPKIGIVKMVYTLPNDSKVQFDLKESKVKF
jgi:hypothetical protein